MKYIIRLLGVLLSISHITYASSVSVEDKIIKQISNVELSQYCSLIKKKNNNTLDFNKSSCSKTIVTIYVKRGDVTGRLSERPNLLVGSGVLIAPNLVLTNNHVISSKDILEHTTLIVDHFSTTDSYSIKPKKLRIQLDDDSIFFTDTSMDFTIFEVVKTKRPVAIGHKETNKYNLEMTYSISSPAGQSLRYTMPFGLWTTRKLRI